MENNIILDVVLSIVGFLIAALIIKLVYRILSKKVNRQLLPTEDELKRAKTELNRASTNPEAMFEKIVQRYKAANLEVEYSRSDAFVPALVKQTNKFLVQKTTYDNIGNYKIIKAIVENDYKKHFMYALIKTLLVKLILNERFDLEKYKTLYRRIYKFKDSNNKKNANEIIAFLTKDADKEYKEIVDATK